MDVSLYLFGPPRVEADGAAISVSRRKALALLAYLAASERPHSRESLAALLWPEWDGSAARTALRRVLVTANKAAGPGGLLIEQARIALTDEGGVWVDVRAFRQALQRSRGHRHANLPTCEDCLGWLGEAATLYTGDLLAGFGLDDSPEFDDWVTFEAESLRRDVGEVLEKLAEIHAARQEFAQAIACARRWLALDPLHEPAQRMLIRLHAWAGDTASALRQYREYTELLQRELGVAPQAETTELYEQVKSGFLIAPALSLALSTPPSPTPQTGERLIRLPRLPDFVGRRSELAALTALLADPSQRLVTVVGLGGMGKSSLAVKAAAQAAANFPDGAAFVPLAPLSQPGALVSAIAEALHYTFPPDNRPPLQQLTGYLARRRLLLLLDNFEHLLDAAPTLAELLEGTPDVTFLVTSRERLNLRAETLFSLEGMNADDPEAEADGVRLFVQNARRVQPGYTPQAEEMGAIGEICRLVDGMPLGIVLAAGWMGLLTPAEIAGEIRHSLDLLATELRDMPERQQSMRAVMEQTWERLTVSERNTLMRLSVFRGGFTREAAQTVTGTSLRTLLNLSNRQLLERGAEGRYDIHELLRHFAQERLDDAGLSDTAAQAHATYFVVLLERSEGELKGADQQGALKRLRTEQENLRVAWHWALEHQQADELNQAVEAYALFYFLDRRRQEGIEFCLLSEARLSHSAPDSRTHARVLVWHAKLGSPLGLAAESIELCRRSLEILTGLASTGQDVRTERAMALCELGGLVWYSDIAAARQLLAEGVELCRTLNDHWQLAWGLREMARLLLMEGDYPTAAALALEGLEVRQKIGDRLQSTALLQLLGWVMLNLDQPERAMAYIQEHYKIGEELGSPDITSHAQAVASHIHDFEGEYGEARDMVLKALADAQRQELRHHANSCRWHLCKVYVHLGQYQAAYDLAQIALTEAEAIGLDNHRGQTMRSLGMVETVWGNHAAARLALWESVKIFQSIRQSRLVAYGQAFLAYTFSRTSEIHKAKRTFTDGLIWALEHRSIETITCHLPLAALLCAKAGQPERAIELHTLAWRYPRIAKSRWFYDVAGKELESLAESLPPEAVAAAQERGRALDLFPTGQALVEYFGGEEG
jgi:predicted ATPase/DNA-binding SARP family transcriptional activator